ncbi:bifunctional Mitochondrial degradasome RNA helicase subunit [Babesia duncani]|uniref:Bifunctional Mitochondrial degradasome RNA helicase subunit n=1 Tax=Babesia duncani TaxID=323732 RepID=A0AAD9PMU3_9APIC|nr:bifunctional Mitochondrial degradasome RNA helicase subunit [Babesia duncani]
MPPETRRQQIENFNNRKTLILVASDVIGMGVNVRIKRIIFHSLIKFDGNKRRLLTSSEIQQIAGRAGRFSLDCGNGQVGCMRQEDILYLKQSLAEKTPPIEKAYISPSPRVIASFKSIANSGDHFSICNVDILIEVARHLGNISLPSNVLVEYLIVPLNSMNLVGLVSRSFATSHALFNCVKLKNVLQTSAFDVADGECENLSLDDIKRLELLYQILDAYVWLSVKFPNIYKDQKAAIVYKTRIACIIQEALTTLQFEPDSKGSDHESTNYIFKSQLLRHDLL